MSLSPLSEIDTPGVHERLLDSDDETFLDPNKMAETYCHLAEQDDISTQLFEVHIKSGPQNSEFI